MAPPEQLQDARPWRTIAAAAAGDLTRSPPFRRDAGHARSRNASMNETSKTYSALELLCVFFWFLLDGFWLIKWTIAVHVFSALALAAAASMFFFIKREIVLVLVACADLSWLVCNITWAAGDLSHVPGALFSAKVVFFVGLALCGGALFAADSDRRWSSLILRRIRIIRFFER
jgi:hypothetical protein